MMRADTDKIDTLTALMNKRLKEDYKAGKYAGRAGENQYHVERALWNLLCHAREELPVLDDYFHKSFRQVDVTSSGALDMALWNLLSASELFWECFDIARGVKDDDVVAE